MLATPTIWPRPSQIIAGQDGLDRLRHADHVDVERLPERGRFELRNLRERADAGAGDQNIDGAERARDLGDRPDQGVPVGDVDRGVRDDRTLALKRLRRARPARSRRDRSGRRAFLSSQGHGRRMADSVGGAGDQDVGLSAHRVALTIWARGSCAIEKFIDELDEPRPVLLGSAMLGTGNKLIDAVRQVLAQIIRRGQERRMLTEDGEHRLRHALNQLFGQARDGLGVVAAGGMGQSQETIQAGQADGLTKLQEPLAIEMKDLVEEPAQVIPVLGGKGHARLRGFLAKVLPVPPAAQIFEMAEGRE